MDVDDKSLKSPAEAVHQLTQHAEALTSKLAQLISALQESSCRNVRSTLQHLVVYDEAVGSLQVTCRQLWFGPVTITLPMQSESLCCHRKVPRQSSAYQTTCSTPVSDFMGNLLVWTPWPTRYIIFVRRLSSLKSMSMQS